MIAEKVKTIGLNILYYRRMRHWTQEELAIKAGISKSYLSQIERGTFEKEEGCDSFAILYKIADVLDISVEQLMANKK